MALEEDRPLSEASKGDVGLLRLALSVEGKVKA